MVRPETEWRWRTFDSVYQSHGFPKDELAKAMPWRPAQLHDLRSQFRSHILKEDDTLDIGNYSFRCVETPGHSPGHICLYESNQKILVSGDHILDTIIPNIGYWSELENPFEEYLASLEKVSQLEVDVVLPGHRNIFYDLTRRIIELKKLYATRLTQILISLDGGEKTLIR
ncbi:MBL fold metallo-hydrolase [Chloroflexota bacterium]